MDGVLGLEFYRTIKTKALSSQVYPWGLSTAALTPHLCHQMFGGIKATIAHVFFRVSAQLALTYQSQ